LTAAVESFSAYIILHIAQSADVYQSAGGMSSLENASCGRNLCCIFGWQQVSHHGITIVSISALGMQHVVIMGGLLQKLLLLMP